jgi:hypothetical protein
VIPNICGIGKVQETWNHGELFSKASSDGQIPQIAIIGAASPHGIELSKSEAEHSIDSSSHQLR